MLLLLPALATLVWLIAVTDVRSIVSSWWLLLLLLALGGLFALLKLANLSDGHRVYADGSHGRFLTWSAVLIIGPTALWLDIVVLLLLTIKQRHHLPKNSYALAERRWASINRLLVVLVRDTLPGLVAFSLYRYWGGALPFSFQAETAVLPALYAISVRIGLVILPMALIYVVNRYGRSWSLFERGQWLVKFGAAIFLFYMVPEPFSLLAAGLFQQSGAWLFLAFWVAVYLLSLAAHLLNKTAVQTQQRATELHHLERLAQTILREPAENTDLPRLLSRYVPDIFSDAWVEIRLLPDTILFAQGNGWIPLENEHWTSLLTGQDAAWVVPGLPEAIESGFGAEALVIPVRTNEEDIVASIYLMRLGKKMFTSGKRSGNHWRLKSVLACCAPNNLMMLWLYRQRRMKKRYMPRRTRPKSMPMPWNMRRYRRN